jgi:glycosyltransferase involved in cell wall biosynthesis
MTKYSQFDFIILMASRLEKEKNIFLAIDVMKEVVKKYPKIGLVIVGEGTLKQSLQKTVCSLRLERNIIFERWNDDLVSYYKTADLFLSTSDYEGYGMTLIEAGVSGCPILTTDVGLVGEILSEGAVEICIVGDKKCFVKKLERLLNDKNRLQEMSVKAKEEIKNRVISDNQEYLNQIKKDWERCLK